MLRAIQVKYERFLLVNPGEETATLVRTRALYCFGWAFVLIQLLNILSMSLIYGGWSTEHNIALGAICLILGLIHSLRYFRNFLFYACAATALCVSAPLATALYDYTGINTSLLPFLIMIPMLSGFIAGPRMCVASGMLALMSVGILFYCSWSHLEAQITPADAVLQRTVQASFSIIMVTLITATFSANTFRAFELMEENLQRAKKAEQAKSQFLLTMSHDLKTPLNVILELTRILRLSPRKNEHPKILNMIQKSGKALLADINDILDVSELEKGVLRLEENSFCLREMLKLIAHQWRDLAAPKGISVNSVIDKSVPDRLLGDDVRLQQVVSNIVSNAIKYSDGGRVFIFAAAEAIAENRVRLTIKVTDQGAGIPEHQKETLFESFGQSELSSGGQGLGLPSSKKLVELMGGNLEFTSRVGEGTTFTIAVPFDLINANLRTQPYAA